MKKILYIIIFCIMLIPNVIYAKEKELNMYLFYGNGCPHCIKLEKYLDNYLKDKPNIKLYEYEVWYNEENRNLLKEIYKINKSDSGVPYLVVGQNVIIGFAENHTEEQIINTINYYLNIDYEDKVGIYLGVVEEKDKLPEKKLEDIDLPTSLTKIIKNSPLIITSIIKGLVDGFNPCTIWIIILLVSMILGVKDKKRKWILGLSFLLSTATIYFAFLTSMLDLSVFLNNTAYIRLAISTSIVMFGFYLIVKVIKSKYVNESEFDKKSEKKIINTITTILKEKSFILVIVGVILLSFAVNIIQLLSCSLELQAMFSQILIINDISMKYRILYSLVYVISFILDDFIVIFILIKTLEIKTISNKFDKYLLPISGIIMMIIGFLMIYKPGWLMLNF